MSSSLMRTVASYCMALALLAGAATLRADVAPEAVKFKDGDHVCFIGDSITHGGGFGYHSQIVLFYATRFPQMHIGYWNCGISGDSAAGAVKRYAWDIALHKPTVATIMLGMNDVSRGLYAKGLSGAKVEAQRQGAIENHVAKMAELAELLAKDGAKIIFITPSIYDQTGTQQTENLYTELSGRLDQQLRQLDHIDVQIHEVHQFIEEHKPSLARAVGLLDTGAKFQGFLTGKKGKK